MSKAPEVEKLSLQVDIAKDAYEIMERLRGPLSRDSFIELVLRMIDSNAVSRPPVNLPPES
jgi:hypothetical protein